MHDVEADLFARGCLRHAAVLEVETVAVAHNVRIRWGLAHKVLVPEEAVGFLVCRRLHDVEQRTVRDVFMQITTSASSSWDFVTTAYMAFPTLPGQYPDIMSDPGCVAAWIDALGSSDKDSMRLVRTACVRPPSRCLYTLRRSREPMDFQMRGSTWFWSRYTNFSNSST
uniref:Uncharacterized protein n=1 Tax=Globisporangium ultimum (strain ATCC 200006 / CBS 805.95 / DAOM BR144) TaxID=431595 RepID=K3WXE7_GLOUD